jgi:hypothetical protein
MIAGGDPIAVELFNKYKRVNMPNLQLANMDINALIDYIDAQSIKSKSAPQAERAADVVARSPGR